MKNKIMSPEECYQMFLQKQENEIHVLVEYLISELQKYGSVETRDLKVVERFREAGYYVIDKSPTNDEIYNNPMMKLNLGLYIIKIKE